jgi:uncharacterized protein
VTTSLREAIETRNEPAALELLNASPELAFGSNANGVSLLMLALYYELPALARVMARHKPLDVFEAASLGELEAAKQSGLVDTFSTDGFTLLGLAIFFRQSKVAEYLVNAGADINLASRNAQGVAPIHAACARGDLDTLRLLIAKGADVNLPQSSGFRPIDAAKQSANPAMLEILKAAGAKES